MLYLYLFALCFIIKICAVHMTNDTTQNEAACLLYHILNLGLVLRTYIFYCLYKGENL